MFQLNLSSASVTIHYLLFSGEQLAYSLFSCVRIRRRDSRLKSKVHGWLIHSFFFACTLLPCATMKRKSLPKGLPIVYIVVSVQKSGNAVPPERKPAYRE